MSSQNQTSAEQLREGAQFENEPLTRPEYLSVMVHFYRGEVQRSTVWRQRLDATTNWAVLTSAGMLSFSFANPQHPHVLLLLTNIVVFAFLIIEARRYRRYEVYQARVRMIEENVLLPIVSRQLLSPKPDWQQQICNDLNQPTYKAKLIPTIGLRLRQNYGAIFAVLLGSWLVKLELHPTLAGSLDLLWQRMSVGSIVPASMVASAGVLFYGLLVWMAWEGRSIHPIGPADEVEGIEQALDRWKF